jgi:molybdate transport system substrate-binding protein
MSLRSEIRGARFGSSLMAGILALALMTAPAAAWAADTLVFAAASLKNAMDGAAKAYEAKTGHKISVSYAASSALAKQIEQGAPADIFISADLDWMDYLAGKNLIRNDTRHNLLGNTLVLVAPTGSHVSLKIAPHFDLAKALGDGRLAVADPAAVPAGKYAKAALEKLGVWDSVKGKLAPAENVRATLAFIAQGEAPLGIVYQTDATAEPKVEVVDTFPADSHAPIIYPVAQTASSTNPDASAFLAFLKTDDARQIFEGQGFQVLK